MLLEEKNECQEYWVVWPQMYNIEMVFEGAVLDPDNLNF
jgi:hypothetical protein